MDVEALFSSSVLAADDLLFREIKMREELGRLPEYHVELLRDSKKTSAIEAKKLLGQKATVSIKIDNSTERYVHGIVTHFERGGASGAFDVYRVVMRPWLWQLRLGADCRVFQDKSVVDILDAIFNEYGTSGSVTKRLSNTYKSRPYTVQYRESDFDFVQRLMEESGIYYYFKHEKSDYKLVLCDGPSGHDASSPKKLDLAEKQKGAAHRDDVILRWSRAHTLQSLTFAHTDFAAEAPATDLFATATRSPAPTYPKPNDLEVFDYPGGHDDLAMAGAGSKAADGKALAQIEVDRFESGHSVATARTSCRGPAVGQTFTLASHGEDDGDYLITSAITQMEYSGYEANFDKRSSSYESRFNCVPKSVAFQPPRTMPRPVVHGPQTAIVQGPDGDEIHTDKYGRVKIQFHWDRVAKKDKLLEKSSCWVRVSQPWASKGFGMVMLPRVGDEVVVDFLEGDPDRPLITGRVFNGTNMQPWTLPDQATVSGVRTRSSKGGADTNFNELRFDDKKDSEYVWFQAEKDFHRLVKNDDYDTVSNDQWTEVTKNAQHKVGENLTLSVGKVATVSIAGDTHAKLGADLNTAVTGALNLAVTDKTAVKGTGAVALTSEQGMDVKAGMAFNASAGTTLHLKAGTGVVIDGGVQLCIKAGPAFIVLGPDGVTIQGPMVKINSGGSAGQANDAAAASPAAPKDPGDPKKNEDPLAKK